MRGHAVDPARAGIYLDKAREFAASARDAESEERWNACVSAAAHAIINASDAACVRYLGRRAAGASHAEAIDLLKEIGEVPARERTRLTGNLEALLDLKHRAEYADRSCTRSDAARAVKAMARGLETVESWAKDW